MNVRETEILLKYYYNTEPDNNWETIANNPYNFDYSARKERELEEIAKVGGIHGNISNSRLAKLNQARKLMVMLYKKTQY